MGTAVRPGALARAVARRLVELRQHTDVARFVPLPAPAPAAALVSVYRRRNVDAVERVVRSLPAGTEVRLWGLDGTEPRVADVTVGEGPGARLDLLRRAAAALPAPVDLLVLCDDDVEVVVGDLDRLLRAGVALDLDLFQPAHVRTSVHTFPFVRKSARSFGRLTAFVEQGPLTVLSSRAQEVLLPLADGLGPMGWGVEVRWALAATAEGLRSGIVDAVGIRHVSAPTHDYDTSLERAHLEEELSVAGLEDVRDLQRVEERIGPFAAWRLARGAHRGAP